VLAFWRLPQEPQVGRVIDMAETRVPRTEAAGVADAMSKA